MGINEKIGKGYGLEILFFIANRIIFSLFSIPLSNVNNI
jgi:hypothetical protein